MMPAASSYRPIRARTPGTPFSSSSHRRTAAAAAVRPSAATASSRWASSSAGSGTARLRRPAEDADDAAHDDTRLPSAPVRPDRSPTPVEVQREAGLHRRSAETVGGRPGPSGCGRRFDHHPDQRLGAARPHAARGPRRRASPRRRRSRRPARRATSGCRSATLTLTSTCGYDVITVPASSASGGPALRTYAASRSPASRPSPVVARWR